VVAARLKCHAAHEQPCTWCYPTDARCGGSACWHEHLAVERGREFAPRGMCASMRRVVDWNLLGCCLHLACARSLQPLECISSVSWHGVREVLLTVATHSLCLQSAAFPNDPEGQLDTILPRLLYCLIYFGQFLFALYKLNNMGLLPTHASDWLFGVPPPPVLEHSYAAL